MDLCVIGESVCGRVLASDPPSQCCTSAVKREVSRIDSSACKIAKITENYRIIPSTLGFTGLLATFNDFSVDSR